MRRNIFLMLAIVIASLVVVSLAARQNAYVQQRGGLAPEVIARRNSIEQELQALAVVDRKVMIPVRDGKRMATDVYRPKDTSKKYPTVFVRTPYNFNFWDVRNGVPRDLSNELDAVKRGYAF